MTDFDAELSWVFTTLCALTSEISPGWLVVLRLSETDENDIAWVLFPYEGDLFSTEDWSIAEEHPDKLTLKYREGLIFAYPSSTPRSQRLAARLKTQPEMAGRII